MFLDEDKVGNKPKVREARAMFLIAMTALAACVAMVISLMSPPAVALDTIKTSGIEKTANDLQPVHQPTQK
ncbi:MAG TPA: hypothetical protein VGN93_16885 [Shinella sp.]|uniref:hypothetical protein n=1 Tax=Shinella sp. TaxID=1870904 RepID=UPI0029A53A1D|nr:hypothetical protein [Shinella sp.]MDX3977230.1 hypothetical protein [Shinella sp.]HEV7248653.1 hypothetical protein [Shinella sp.]